MRALRVGIVSSVGGHLTEVLELERILSGCDRFLVLNDEAPWRSGLKDARLHRITHAERDTRQLINLAEAARILWKERPDVLISSGASPAVPFFLLARLFGIETIFIEFFGAVKEPSLTARLVYPLTRHFFVQWPELRTYFPRAKYAGPLFVAPAEPLPPLVPPSAELQPVQVLVTLGSSPRPMRRLLRDLDELYAAGQISGRVLVQTAADDDYRPRHLELVRHLPERLLIYYLRTATTVICHGGCGVLGICLKYGRHPIVVPRRAAAGEAVNDHQWMLSEALANRQQATLCEDGAALAAALHAAALSSPSGKPAPAPPLEKGLHATLFELLAAIAQKRQRTYG